MKEITYLKTLNDRLWDSNQNLRQLEPLVAMVPKLRLANDHLKRQLQQFSQNGVYNRASRECSHFHNSNDMKNTIKTRLGQVQVINTIFNDVRVTHLFDHDFESRIDIISTKSLLDGLTLPTNNLLDLSIFTLACDLKGMRQDCFVSFVNLMDVAGCFTSTLQRQKRLKK